MTASNPPSISPSTPPVYMPSSSQIGASASSNPMILLSSLTVYTHTTVPILWTPTTPGSKSTQDTDPIDLHSSSVTTRASKASESGGRRTTRRGWSFTASHTWSASPISSMSADPISTAETTVIMTGSELLSALSYKSSVSEKICPSSSAIPSSAISRSFLPSSSSSSTPSSLTPSSSTPSSSPASSSPASKTPATSTLLPSTPAPSSQSNLSPTPTSTSTPAFSTTTLIAAPIGMTIGLVFLLALLSWLIRRWRKKRKVGVDGSGSESRNSNLPPHDKRKIRERVLRVHAGKAQGEKGGRGYHTRTMEEEGVGIRVG